MSRKKNRFLNKGAYIITKAFTLLTLNAPRFMAFWAGSATGWLLWIFLRVQKKRLEIIIENMRNLYPAASRKELYQLTRRVCRHFGRLLSECGRLPLVKRESFEGRIRFEGLEHFTKAYAHGKGVILATAHFGNFEIGVGALAAMGYPAWYVLRTVDNEAIDELFDEIRRSTGLGIIKKDNAAKQIISHLRLGAVVSVHIDQNAGFNNMFVPFFGKLAATITTPAVLSQRTGAQVLSMFCFRQDATDSYTIKFEPVEITPTGDTHADTYQMMAMLTQRIERAIRQAPEQWFWIHRRWKTRPSEHDIESVKKFQTLQPGAETNTNKNNEQAD